MDAYDTEDELHWDDSFSSNVRRIKLLSFADIAKGKPSRKRKKKKPAKRPPKGKKK